MQVLNLEQLLFVYKIDSPRSKVVDGTCSIVGGENPADNTSVEETVSVELPLPELCQGGDDQSSLSHEQETDSTLACMRK